MLVKTSQLVSGCILTKDVIGKTNRPLIYKKTVLTEELIEILRKFLIPTVRVAKNLENGEVFKPVTVQGKQIKQQRSFIEHYLEVVQKYKKLFDHWQHNMHIHMPYVRKLIIPLLERIDGIGIDVFRLHHYSSKEDYFFHHSISVAIISAFLAKKLGYEKGEWLQVGLAGFLSDCGMAKMSMPIINKFHSLSRNEMDEMKRHPKYSYSLVKSIPTLTKKVKLAIVQHHERLDGSGYPLQLKGDKIHKYARIIAVSDTYHAMTCKRVYQQQQSPFKVIKELKQAKFKGLDPTVVQTLIRNFVNLSAGIKVLLSNDQVGKIVFIEEQLPNRPMIQLDNTEQIINLETDLSLYIKDIFKK